MTLKSARAELQDLKDVLRSYVDEPPPEWSAEWFSWQSLLQRDAELHHQIRLLEGTADVEITLLGGAEGDHRVKADFLGRFLEHLQGAVGAAAQNLIHGDRGVRGALPRDVLGAATLRVAATPAGSFRLLIDGPVGRAAQTTMEGEEEIPAFDLAVRWVLDLLATSEAGDDDALLSTLSDIGSRRALEHVRKLMHSVTQTQTTAKIVQRGLFQATPREGRLSPALAEHLETVLTTTVQSTVTIRRSGRLSGVVWRRGLFELEAESDRGPDVISGRVVADLRPIVQSHFDTWVDAALEQTTTTLANGDTRITYRLVALDAGDWASADVAPAAPRLPDGR